MSADREVFLVVSRDVYRAHPEVCLNQMKREMERAFPNGKMGMVHMRGPHPIMGDAWVVLTGDVFLGETHDADQD